MPYWNNKWGKPIVGIKPYKNPNTWPTNLGDDDATLIYNGNGSTGGVVPLMFFGQGDRIVSAVGNLVKSGYTFKEWNTNADGTGTAYLPGSTITIGFSSVTLYARWTLKRSYGEYDSGVMSLSIDSGTGGHGFNPIVVAANQANYGVIKGFFTTSYSTYNGKNLPAIQRTPGFVVGGYNPEQSAIIVFRPETPWLKIRKIKVYTNIISSNNSGTQVRLQGIAGYNYYNIDHDLDDDPTTSNVGQFLGNGAGNVHTLMDFQLNNTVAGTASAGTASIYTSANIGDPGTIWGEKVAFSDNNSNVSLDSDNIILEGTFIGNKSLGTIPYPYSGSWQIPQNTPVEKYYSSYISFQMWPLSYANYGNIPDLKFRFVIEYDE